MAQPTPEEKEYSRQLTRSRRQILSTALTSQLPAYVGGPSSAVEKNLDEETAASAEEAEEGGPEEWARQAGRPRLTPNEQSIFTRISDSLENLSETIADDPEYQDMMALLGAAQAQGGMGAGGVAARYGAQRLGQKMLGAGKLGAALSKYNALTTGISVGLRMRQRMQQGSARTFLFALALAIIKDFVDIASIEIGGLAGSLLNIAVTWALFTATVLQGSYIIKFIIKKMWKWLASSAIAEFIPIINIFPSWTISVLLMWRAVKKKIREDQAKMDAVIEDMESLQQAPATNQRVVVSGRGIEAASTPAEE